MSRSYDSFVLREDAERALARERERQFGCFLLGVAFGETMVLLGLLMGG